MQDTHQELKQAQKRLAQTHDEDEAEILKAEISDLRFTIPRPKMQFTHVGEPLSLANHEARRKEKRAAANAPVDYEAVQRKMMKLRAQRATIPAGGDL